MLDAVEVTLDVAGSPAVVGTAHFSLRRGTLSTSFAYDINYIARPESFAIDPALPLRLGTFHCAGLPGALRDAGTGSLGGTRPKASVVDDGHLFIAKFSHDGDAWNVIAWEKTALDLAEKAGIAVPHRRLLPIGKQRVLLLERFDRRHGRIDGSWGLAPAFDLNPEPSLEKPRATALFVTDRAAGAGNPGSANGWAASGSDEVAGAQELAVAWGIRPDRAAAIVRTVVDAVAGTWQAVARANRCPEAEMRLFEPVFRNRTAALSRAFGV